MRFNIRQQASFTAEARLDYAITRMGYILAAQEENPELWYENPIGTTSLFFTVTTAKGTRSTSGGTSRNRGGPITPNDSTTTCNNFN
jgi:hypothetical protein